MKINFYYIDDSYIAFLKEYKMSIRGFSCVPNTQYSGNKKFFYGAVLEVDGIYYYVPVSSKTKGKQDDILIRDKNNVIKSSLRFAFMLPVPNQCLHTLIIDNIDNQNRKILISKELAFCRRNKDKISKQAMVTYNRILSNCYPDLNNNSEIVK